jgi:phosphoesterase RecJ-like protein
LNISEPGDAKLAADIKALVQKSPRILITGHERPDGDCIGSEVGLCSTLRAAGFNASIINADPVPTRFEFLNEGGMVRQGVPTETYEADLLFVLDATDLRRLGKLKRENFKVAEVIDIDHHLENPHFGKINWIETHASSTGELIYRLAQNAGWTIPPVGLKALYAAIVTDTGQFSYSNTSSRVLQIAAKLIEQGVNPEDMWKRIYLNKSAAELALESRARASMELRANGQICSISLRWSDFMQTGTSSQHTEEFAGIPRSIEGVRLALFMYEIDEGRGTKVSVRTMPGLDASAVAKAFGGGGHRQAAGCTLPFKLDEAKPRVFAEAEKVL